MKNQLIEHLEMIVKFLELNNEIVFKIKAYQNVINQIYLLDFNEHNIYDFDFKKIKGVGDSTLQIIQQFLTTHNSQTLEKYIQTTPAGIIEMMFSIRGIGIKKIAQLWKEHNITNVESLFDLCKKNELRKIKGFGEKLEDKMLQRIEFYFQNKGLILYAKILPHAQTLCKQLNAQFSNNKHSITGKIRRQLPIIDKTEILTTTEITSLFAWLFEQSFIEIEIVQNTIYTKHNLFRAVAFICCDKEEYYKQLFLTSADKSFLEHFKLPFSPQSEEEIFLDNASVFIPPFLRENTQYVSKVFGDGFFQNIIKTTCIKGLIHCHSTWSDGENSLKQMAVAAIQTGFEYMLITDHSKSSFIANGLNEERLQQQFLEIDELNKTLFPFKIFKGIECDILNDGELDYDLETLKQFDLIIASVHQNLEMTKEKATERVLKAIQHPCTHILGHSCGRLLLNRKGYELDYDIIFAACKKNNVSIELNANPYRLDIDWSLLDKLKSYGLLTSINPDAHSLKGIADIEYGVAIAQKGALMPSQNISSFSLLEFENFIKTQKQKAY